MCGDWRPAGRIAARVAIAVRLVRMAERKWRSLDLPECTAFRAGLIGAPTHKLFLSKAGGLW